MAALERERKPWETSAAGQFLTIDLPRGAVAVESLGHERFRVSTPGDERKVVGFAAGGAAANRLAAGLEGGGA
jgi:hypothetical protein